MKEFYNEIYRSFRDSVEDFYSIEGVYEEVDEVAKYYNAYISNYVAETNNYLYDEATEMKEKGVDLSEDLFDAMEGSIADKDDRPLIPQIPESAVNIDDVLDKAYKKCARDVKARSILKNEIEYFIDELEENNILDDLNEENLFGLEGCKVFRDAIIAACREERLKKSQDADERV